MACSAAQINSNVIFFRLSGDMSILGMNNSAMEGLLKGSKISQNYLDYCRSSEKRPIISEVPNEPTSLISEIDGVTYDIKILPCCEREVAVILDPTDQALHEQLENKLEKITGERPCNNSSIEELFDKLVNFYEYILFHMPANVYWSDRNGITLGCNRRVLQLLGLNSVDEFSGMSYYEMAMKLNWSAEAAESFARDDLYVLENGLPIISREEIPIKNEVGDTLYYESDRIPIKNASDNVIGVIGISHDVTRYKLLQKDLEAALALAEQSEKKRKEFLKNQEHDINTAISGIEYASVIMESSDDLDAIHYVAKEITVCAKRLKNYNKTLIKDLAWLDGEGKVVEQRMSIRDVCSNLYGLNSLSAKNKGISFIVNVADEIPDYFMGDEMILFQSLQNLVANAIQFTEEGTIEIMVNIVEQCYKKNNHMLLAFHIKDSGRGIDAKHQRYIFDDFFKVVPSNEPDLISGVQADQDKGRGLGLTLSKKYIETMGGELHLHKSELGVGSEFVATLPLKVALNQQKPS